MNDSKSQALQQAHELIERGELEAAQELLAPLLETDADDAALWWVYAHAVRDSDIGQAALRRVLELDPQYPGASELAQELDSLDEPELSGAALTVDESSAAPEINIDDWEDLQPIIDSPPPAQSSRLVLIVVSAALLLLVVGGALIAVGAIDINQLLARLSPTEAPASVTVDEPIAQPTEADNFSIGTAVPPAEISPAATAQEQSAATADATLVAIAEQQEAARAEPPTLAAEAQAVAVDIRADDISDAATPTDDATTEPSPTAEPTANDATSSTTQPILSPTASPTFVPLPRAESGFVELVIVKLSASELRPRQAFLSDSDAGNTLVFEACATPGADFNAKIATIMAAVVALANEIPSELDAVAAGMRNCADMDSPLRIIGAEVSLIRDFADGVIDDKAFQREWQQLG